MLVPILFSNFRWLTLTSILSLRSNHVAAIPSAARIWSFSRLYPSVFVINRSDPAICRFIKSLGIGWEGLWEILSSERILKSLQLSFSSAIIAALINVVLACYWHGVWCVIAFRVNVLSMHWSICLLPYQLQLLVLL